MAGSVPPVSHSPTDQNAGEGHRYQVEAKPLTWRCWCQVLRAIAAIASELQVAEGGDVFRLK